MKVEILKKFLTGEYVFIAGDTRVVPDVLGKHLCEVGAAKDVDGVIPTGTPNVNEVILVADDVIASTRASEVR